MVKPEFKGEKPPLLLSNSKTSMEISEDDNEPDLTAKMVTKSEGELVVSFDEQRSRKSPRVCIFVCLFVFILLVGFLAVYLIGRTHGNKHENGKVANMADDIATVPQETNTSILWKQNVSWETQDELFQLSDAIGSDDIIGLRPIFRKDLPADYIAYWELKLNGKTGEKYVVISAAKETGDHRLAEEGPVPSPSDVMSDQAKRLGYKCHRVYRLTSRGLMVCEDRALKRIVAATNDVVNPEAMFHGTRWRKLDKQVSAALPKYKKAWGDLAKRVYKLPEWNRFKWLSMKSGQWPTTEPINTGMSSDSWRKSKKIKDYDKDNKHRNKWKWHRYRNRLNYDDDDEEVELGLRPGEVIQVPVGRGFREVRIRFSGFGKAMRNRHEKRKSWQRWQRRLCRVLCDACEGSDYTRVKQKYIKKTKMGDRYIKLRIESDSHYVRKQLQGQEIRFRIELKTGRQKLVVVNYGIVLKASRRGRSLRVNDFSIPYKQWFPDYKQHKHGNCMTGSGPVALAMVLGYYDNLAYRVPRLGFPKNAMNLFPGTGPASLKTTKRVQMAVEAIVSKISSNCRTSPAKMKRIRKWLHEYSVPPYTLMMENEGANRHEATALAVKLLRQRIPVIVSQERGESGVHHYAVATRLRQRTNRYRVCSKWCHPWETMVINEVYIHLGTGARWNKWESADTFFVAALIKK